MTATAFFRGEGGHVWEMDLPLREQHARDLKEGRLVQVNRDGSDYTEPSREDEPLSEDQNGPAREDGETQTADESAVVPRPNRAASKAAWVAYAVSLGTPQDEADGMTRTALMDKYGDNGGQD